MLCIVGIGRRPGLELKPQHSSRPKFDNQIDLPTPSFKPKMVEPRPRIHQGNLKLRCREGIKVPTEQIVVVEHVVRREPSRRSR